MDINKVVTELVKRGYGPEPVLKNYLDRLAMEGAFSSHEHYDPNIYMADFIEKELLMHKKDISNLELRPISIEIHTVRNKPHIADENIVFKVVCEKK